MKRLLLLVVWLLLTPCLVQASCGDWLAHPDDKSTMGSSAVGVHARAMGGDTGSMGMSTASSPADTAAMPGTKQSMPIRRLPCDGPGCRQAPANPPVPTTIPPVELKWCTWCPGDSCPSADVLLYEMQYGAGHVLDGFRPTIERPPQS